MTSRSNEVQAERSFDKHQTLSKLRKTDSFLFVMQGELLNDLRSKEAYKLTNGGMSWEDYLKQPEVSLTPKMAKDMIEAYLLFCVSMQLTHEDVGYYPLSALKFILNKYRKGLLANATQVKEILDASLNLSFKDLKEFFHDREMQGIEEAPRTYEFVIMKRCIETNGLAKVHDISSEDIKKKFKLE